MRMRTSTRLTHKTLHVYAHYTPAAYPTQTFNSSKLLPKSCRARKAMLHVIINIKRLCARTLTYFQWHDFKGLWKIRNEGPRIARINIATMK